VISCRRIHLSNIVHSRNHSFRLQRAQEERSRRHTNRYYEENSSYATSDIHADYRNGSVQNPFLSSSSNYMSSNVDQRLYIPNNPSLNQTHSTAGHPYAAHSGIMPTMNSQGQSYVAYFPPHLVRYLC
jgi:hypothetical protein